MESLSDNTTWSDIEDASVSSANSSPQILSFEGADNIALHNPDGGEMTEVFSWVTDGSTYFFLPNDSGVSNVTATVADDQDTTFSIIQGDNIKTFENVRLPANTEVKIEIATDTDTAISDVQMFSVENGVVSRIPENNSAISP
jgi:hypothetical protein